MSGPKKRAIRCQAKSKSNCRIHGSGSHLANLVEQEHKAALAGNVSEYLKIKEEIDALEKEYKAVEERQEKEMAKELTHAGTPDPYLVKSRWADEDTKIEHDHIQDAYYHTQEGMEEQLEKNGGKAEFEALFDMEGNIIPAKLIETQYGMSWAILSSSDPSSPFSGKFFNASKAQNPEVARRNNAKKGYYVGKIAAPAAVRTRTISGYYTSFQEPYYARKKTDFHSEDIETLDNGQ